MVSNMSTKVLTGQFAKSIQSHAWMQAASGHTSSAELFVLPPPPVLLEDGSYGGQLLESELFDNPHGQHSHREVLELQLAKLEGDLPKQLEQARLRGVSDGTNAGFERGKQAGFEVALAEMQPVMDRMAGSIAEFATLRRRIRHEAEQDLVRLSLAIARKILHRELTVDPQALSGVIKAVLERTDAREVQRIRLHPGEWATVRMALQTIGLPETVEIVSDGSLDRGAILIDTICGEMDGSISTQLQEIEHGFVDRLEKR